MQLNRLPEWSAKLAAAIFCADFATMLLMNSFRLYTQWLPFVFFASLAVAGVWIFRSGMIQLSEPGYLSPREVSILVLLVLAFTLLISGTRISYLLEGHLHHLVGPFVYDDTWHFQEINSLVNSVRYPAHYNLIPGRYFSLYYAPWMLIAALYRAFPLDGFTIKAAFFFGCAIYNVLIGLTLLYLGFSRASSRKHFYWALYLIGCWAGGSSIFCILHPLQDQNWWMTRFGIHVQFSSYSVVSIWSVHHLSATVALLLCWHIWDIRGKQEWPLIVFCSLLISYGFYASIFVFLGALPMGIFILVLALPQRSKQAIKIICLSALLSWPMLWIYLGKSSRASFLFPFVGHIKLNLAKFPQLSRLSGGIGFGLAVFVVLIFINFLPQWLALIFYGRKLVWQNKILIVLAIAFMASTYFIGFTEGNNYATRSSLIPLIIFSWLCAGILPAIRISTLVIIALLLGALGSFQENIWAYAQTWQTARMSPLGKYDSTVLAINLNRHTSRLPRAEAVDILAAQPDAIYAIERFVPGGKRNLLNADLELECKGPRGPWRWESTSDISVRPAH